MQLYDYIIFAFAMAMDAFAVSICKGVTCRGKYTKTGLVCGAWFGGFQALMPLLGWIVGLLLMQMNWFQDVSSYVAFGILTFLGGKMIFESFEKEECGCEACCGIDNSLAAKTMFVFAIATSIDALALGVSFSCLSANIWIAITFIGLVTFGMCFIGSIIGSKIGSKYEKKAELAGGIVLVLLAIKFLLDAIL